MTTEHHQQVDIMQGRLSSIRNGRNQSVPSKNWENEMNESSKLTISKVAWTIDSEDFHYIPLISDDGWKRIIDSNNESNVDIPSITCDYFIENPPWKGE